MQITKVCVTRFLSIESAVTCILDQWEELHSEFTKYTEHCYMEDVLHATYVDNYVYFTFLKSILSDVQVAVKSFEGEHTDPVKLLDNLVNLLLVCGRVVNSMAKLDVLKDAVDGHLRIAPYLGYLFESTLSQLSLAIEDEKVIRR